MDSEKLNSFVEKGKEIATEAARAAKEVAEQAASDVKSVIAPPTPGPADGSESADAAARQKSQVEDAAQQALTAIGGFFEQAGNAIKNVAETATKSDLDRDGTAGKPRDETNPSPPKEKPPQSG